MFLGFGGEFFRLVIVNFRFAFVWEGVLRVGGDIL